MKLPNAVIVHGLEQARTALAVGVPVTLLSAPGAAVYAGAAWWRALVAAAAAGRDMPPDILDCGAAPGRALQALRCGQRRLILRARPDVFADLADRAESLGAVLLGEPPQALDLAVHGAARRLEEWLRSQGPADGG
jgi:hypothetical protein